MLCILVGSARNLGAPGRLIIWSTGQANNFVLSKTDILEDFRPKVGLAIFLRARSPIADNFYRNYFSYEDLSLLAQNFR